MIILLDLDGTLTDTAHESFKPLKDGKVETKISEIPIFPGAKDFVKEIIHLGHRPVIISDSHPKYVEKIARLIFNIPFLSLADKPNPIRTVEYIKSNPSIFAQTIDDKNNFIIVGDSWLDIELGRRLGIKTAFVQFYNPSSVEDRDGIGQKWKAINAGPTYYPKSFEHLKNIIRYPINHLLALEAVFQGAISSEAIRIKPREKSKYLTIYRCLARQEKGECDSYARADKYYENGNHPRSSNLVNLLALAVSNYLLAVSRNIKEYPWDCISYISDKESTKPSNKMKAIFEQIQTDFKKETLFYWDECVNGSLRHQPTYSSRREFLSKYFHIVPDIELTGRNIIVIDDQITTSSTADEVCNKLRRRGVENILFVALFHLISPVAGKECPKCKKPMSLKINSKNGSRFYSCIPLKYKGQGCGYIENI